MAVDLGPRLGLLINADIGEAYYDQFRPFLQAIDALLLCAVINSSTLTPPASPSNGDAYLLIGSPTGIWLGRGNQVAVFSDEITNPGTNIKNPGWNYYSPNAGWMVWNTATKNFVVFDGTSWSALTVANQVSLLTNGIGNTSQSRLNLVNGENVTMTSDSNGDVVINANVSGTISAAFSAITAGTNTGTTMVVGSGSSLTTTGSGVISATEINGQAVPVSLAAIATNSSGQLEGATISGSGAGLTTGPNNGVVAGDIVTFLTTHGDITDSGIQVASLAPKASPTLTGTPTAPTAAAGTSTAQIATTAFVTDAIGFGVPTAFSAITAGTNTGTTMVVGSGSVLEATGSGSITATSLDGFTPTGLGAGLTTGPSSSISGDVATFSGTSGQIQDSGILLNSLAPLASPALSGTPTAPTATAGTNTTQIATTAFVTGAIGAGIPTPFGELTTGTNTSATMTVGSGATITPSGSGVVNANQVNGSVVPGSTAVLATDSSGHFVSAVTAGSGTGVTTGPTTSVSGDVASFTGVHGQIADSGVLLSSLAPIASPSFTGTPTAPTAAPGTSTTQLATTAFVEVAVGSGPPTSFAAITSATNTSSALVVGTGASLSATGSGSINATEVKGAVPTGSGAGLTTGPTSSVSGDIATFTSTTGQIADSGIQASSLAPLASPTFTGTPAAPTASPGNNTTQLATTAFVTTAVAGGVGSTGFTNITSGTNSTAAMVIGTGSSLTFSGSGTINANEINAATIPASTKALATNSTGQIIASTLAGTGTLTTGPNSAASGDLTVFSGTSGQISDSGVQLSNVPLLSTSNTFISGCTFDGGVSLPATGVATSSSNFQSSSLVFNATYWDGFESQTTQYLFKYTPQTGTSPLCTLTLSGSTPLGGFYFVVPSLGLSNATTATSATAGSASALPSVPLGYIEVLLNGTTVKIPYYSV